MEWKKNPRKLEYPQCNKGVGDIFEWWPLSNFLITQAWCFEGTGNFRYFSGIEILSCLCEGNETYYGVLPKTKHFGSFVCISDSPNGEKVKNQALTVGAKQVRNLG
jgi:hypothetical protein